MGATEKVRNQVSSLMDDPDVTAIVQRIAYEHAMTTEEARIHYLRQL